MNKYLIIGSAVVLIAVSLILLSQKDKGSENSNQEQAGNLTAVTPLPTTGINNDEGKEATTSSDVKSAEESATITPMQDEIKELIIEDLKVGTGIEAVSGKKITVNYKGTLTDGTKFDSSYDRDQPFNFILGSGQVIQGWDQGFVGMKVGGKRKLTIPPSLGYGSRDMGTIPPNSILIFEVELLEVE